MKKKLIVISILAIIGISFLGYLNYELILMVNNLGSKIDQKDIKINEFEEKIAENRVLISTQKDEINRQINLLNEKNTVIEEYKLVIEEYKLKINEYENTFVKMSDYIDKVNNTLNEERKKKIPDNYYSERLYDYPNSAEGLIDYLTYGFELPTAYKINVFDCSESSAYLEWCLEKQGFDAKIYIGKAPFDQDTNHAWVMVMTEDNYKIAIEATALTGGTEKWVDRLTSIFDNKGRGVISYDENDVVAKRYYESNEDSFESIYEAVEESNLQEWNWWEGAWGLN